MSFIVPPLPGEPLHSLATIADDHQCSSEAVRKAIRDRRIEGVRIADRVFVTDSERNRLLRDGWPSKNPGVSRFWEDWRAFRAAHRTAEVA